jgi:hypothetical protein
MINYEKNELGLGAKLPVIMAFRRFRAKRVAPESECLFGIRNGPDLVPSATSEKAQTIRYLVVLTTLKS